MKFILLKKRLLIESDYNNTPTNKKIGISQRTNEDSEKKTAGKIG